jgi:hypothetical protein
MVVRVEDGRYLARHIPGATLVELEGADHFVSGDPDQILDPVETFLTDQAGQRVTPLALAAIVAVSGSGSAGVLEQLASSAARLRRTSPEGDVVALFDGPATAVRAGLRALRNRPDAAVSLHIAEIARDAEPISGYGVSTALALAKMTPMGSLWTSSTVRDLLAGSGVVLNQAGVHDLGTAGPQRVFVAVAEG